MVRLVFNLHLSIMLLNVNFEALSNRQAHCYSDENLVSSRTVQVADKKTGRRRKNQLLMHTKCNVNISRNPAYFYVPLMP